MEITARVKSYITQMETGKFGTRSSTILKHIMDNPGIDTNQLREQTKIAHQSLTSVITNLLDLGIVKIIEEKEDEHGKYSRYQYINDEKQIALNQKDRLYMKYQQWLKRGLGEFADFLNQPTLDYLEKSKDNSLISESEPFLTSENGQVALF